MKIKISASAYDRFAWLPKVVHAYTEDDYKGKFLIWLEHYSQSDTGFRRIYL